MATFNGEDLNRIRHYLGLPVAYQEYLQERMNAVQALALGVAPSNQITPVQALSGDAVTEIQTALNDLDTLEAKIVTAADKDGLIQAGDLKWAGQGARTGAYYARRNQLVRYIVMALDINLDLSSLTSVMGSFGGGGRLSRS